MIPKWVKFILEFFIKYFIIVMTGLNTGIYRYRRRMNMNQAGIYNYLNILDKAADASWKRLEVVANNLSNVDTPNYKRQDVNFERLLEKELQTQGSLDRRVAHVNLKNINHTTYTDMEDFSYRLDGNNVDEAAEQAEVASEQIRYQMLAEAMSSEFNRLKTAMS
jgi:flagellar basal-body rod protein FlgB